MTTAPVPEWPRIEAVARPDGTGELTIDGVTYPVQAPTVEEVRLMVLARIADTAAELQRPVRVLAIELDGQWPLIVHPDGRVQADDGLPASPAPSPSVFAPNTAGTGEAVLPEAPATGAAAPAVEQPAIEQPDTDAWARAARQAQATAIPAVPQEITDSAPVVEPTSRELPDDTTVVRAHGEVLDAAPFELPDDVTAVRAHSEVVDAAPLLDVPDDVTAVRAHGEAVGTAPVFELPDDVKLVRAPDKAVGTAPFLEPPEVDTVVRTHGEVGLAAPAPAEPVAPRRRRVVWLTAAVVGAVVLVAAGTFGVIALTGNLPEPGPTTPAGGLPGAGATLPVQAPVGYDQTALWSVPVGSEPQILLTPDDGVLAAPVGDDKFAIFDRTTGSTTWEGRDPVEGIRVSQVGEEPVLAADSPGTLHLWPLTAPDPAAATTIELGSDEAEVTYSGPAPLIVLPDQSVVLLDKKSAKPVTRDVPDGATAVVATAEHVIAVGPRVWWTITDDADPVRKSLPRPEQAVGDPTAAIAVRGDQLAVVWRTKDSAKDVLALVSLKSNAIRTTGLIRSSAFPPDAEPLRGRDGTARTIGPVLLDIGPEPVIADLGDITPEAVIGRTVYGTSKSKPAVATWRPDGVKLKITENPAESAPVAALTKNIAFVVATQDGETILYALPRTEKKNS
ncbi:hypothetical protein ACQEVI_00705 [Promicromonospora sp. CA-289599]|uniref:hypothetical protein n=1 Tax=Promicromonospora sp. CA-289599 TaxID=3240014 RepID=UPI003D915564